MNFRLRPLLPVPLALLVACGDAVPPPAARTDASVFDAQGWTDPGDVPVGTLALEVGVDEAVAARDGGASGPYPNGPYGNNVRQVLANLSFEGYVQHDGDGLASARPYGAVTMNDLRSGGRVGVMHIAEFF